MSVVYGHDIALKDDYYLKLAQAAFAKLSQSILPGAFLVNTLPVLSFLPAWLPGAGFQHFAREGSNLTKQMRNAPIKMVENKLVCLLMIQL